MTNIIGKKPLDVENCPYNCTYCHLDPKLVEDLDNDVDNLQKQFAQLRKNVEADVQYSKESDEIKKLEELISNVRSKSKELKADVILPPKEMLNVYLVPSTLLDQLEEYRADQNIAYLLMGAFSGAMLGIFSNWVTDPNFTITPPSKLFLGLFLSLTIFSAIWSAVISKRAQKVKKKMLSSRQ